jgi:hypothetical protein
MKRRLCSLFFALFLLPALGALPEDSGIFTNAGGGVFSAEQWLWFSVAPGEELRLVLNGAELYRGPGPERIFLDADSGGERQFELTAERYGPGETAARESRGFSIYINKKVLNPSAPALRTTDDGEVAFMAAGGPESAVFVSPGEELPATEAAGAVPPGTGTREDPFIYLEDALDFAKKSGRTTIRLAGQVRLRKDLEITGDITIRGTAEEPGAARPGIAIPAPFGVRVNRGILRLRGLTVERKSPGGAAFTVAAGAGLEIADSVIPAAGPLIQAGENGVCLIRDTLVTSVMAGSQRRPVIRAGAGRIYLLRSRFEVAGVHDLFMEMRGGRLSAEESRFVMNAGQTGTLFDLEGVRADFKDLAASVSAADYGSILEIAGSRLVMTGGRFAVSARDGVMVLSGHTEALYSGADFSLSSSFVARIMEIKDRFPLVMDCGFSFSGPAVRSEVFVFNPGGPGPFRPDTSRNGSAFVTGNVFRGFSHILGNEYSMEDLPEFNRAFAASGKPNLRPE